MQAASDIFRWNPSGRWLPTKMPGVPVPCQHGLKPTISSFSKWHTVLLTSLFIRQSLEEHYRMEVLLPFSSLVCFKTVVLNSESLEEQHRQHQGIQYNTKQQYNLWKEVSCVPCTPSCANGIRIQLSQAPLSPHLVPGIGHMHSRNKIKQDVEL